MTREPAGADAAPGEPERREALARLALESLIDPAALRPGDVEPVVRALGEAASAEIESAALAALAALLYGRSDLFAAEATDLPRILSTLWNRPEAEARAEAVEPLVLGLVDSPAAPALAAALQTAPRPGSLAAARATDWLAEIAALAPELLDLERLVDLASPLADSERLLGEVVEPVLDARESPLAGDALDRLRAAFLATRRWKHVAARWRERTGAAPRRSWETPRWTARAFPARAAAGALFARRPFRLAVVQNLRFGQGDELIRVGQLLQGFLAGVPEIEITLLTPRPYLYDHPRIRTRQIRDPASAEVLATEFDGLVDLWEPEVASLNVAPGIRSAVDDLIARRPALVVAGDIGRNQFLYSSVVLEGVDLARRLDLDRLTARQVHDPTRRLLVELGLPRGEARGGTDSVYVATPSPEADAELERLVGRGVRLAVVSPFGGARAEKGFLPDRPELLARELAALVDERYRVLVLPNGSAWSGPREIAAVLSALPPPTRADVVVAPDLVADERGAAGERAELPLADRRMRWYKYFAARADLVVTVEGWLSHLAWLLGRPMRVLEMAQSFDRSWCPAPRRPDQRVTQTLSPRLRPLVGRDRLGPEAPPPVPNRRRKRLLEAALAVIAAAPESAARAALVAALRSPDESVVALALAAFGRLELLPEDRAVLLAALRSPEPELRGSAAEALLASRADWSRELGADWRIELETHADVVRRDWSRVFARGARALPALAVAAAGRDDHFRREAGWAAREILRARSPSGASGRIGGATLAFLRPGTYDAMIWRGVERDYGVALDAIRPNDLVVDVGCHTGAFAVAAARRGARVVGFEASRQNFELARRNTAAYPGISIRWGAIWRSDRGAVRLWFAPSSVAANTGGGGVLGGAPATVSDLRTAIRRAAGDGEPGAPERLAAHPVPAVGLDEVLRELGRVRLLKIDVEGAEHAILASARELGRVDRVVGEAHELDPRALATLVPDALPSSGRLDRRGLAATLAAAGFTVGFSSSGEHLLFHGVRAENGEVASLAKAPIS